jgi:hypothetical protein
MTPTSRGFQTSRLVRSGPYARRVRRCDRARDCRDLNTRNGVLVGAQMKSVEGSRLTGFRPSSRLGNVASQSLPPRPARFLRGSLSIAPADLDLPRTRLRRVFLLHPFLR